MKKVIGVFGVAILMMAMLSDVPSVQVKANEPAINKEVVETRKIPELLTYDDFCKLYTCKEEAKFHNPMIIEVDQEDAVRLMKVAQAEAGEKDSLAIAYVMKVVINRLNDDSFPDTIEEVIKQKTNGKWVFSVMRGGKYDKTVPNANAHYALYLLESGQIDTDAEFFEATWVENSWQSRNLEFLFEYGGHRFYK